MVIIGFSGNISGMVRWSMLKRLKRIRFGENASVYQFLTFLMSM